MAARLPQPVLGVLGVPVAGAGGQGEAGIGDVPLAACRMRRTVQGARHVHGDVAPLRPQRHGREIRAPGSNCARAMLDRCDPAIDVESTVLLVDGREGRRRW